jgi:hypothetical protein
MVGLLKQTCHTTRYPQPSSEERPVKNKALQMKNLFARNQRLAPAPQQPLPSLAFCLVMDALGMASFALPFFGELFDLVWAPLSAFIYWRTFGGVKGFFGGTFNFLEELLPGMDFIPTFTITWFMQSYRRSGTTFPARARR